MSFTPSVAEALNRVLGRNITSLHVAREHGRAIDAILGMSISAHFREELESRKEALKARWGGWQQNDTKLLEISPIRPSKWLSNRRQPERDFYMLKEAAHQLLSGNGRLVRIMVEALSAAEKYPVCMETFRLWVLRTGVAKHVAPGEYAAGPNAKQLASMTWDDMSAEIESV